MYPTYVKNTDCVNSCTVFILVCKTVVVRMIILNGYFGSAPTGNVTDYAILLIE